MSMTGENPGNPSHQGIAGSMHLPEEPQLHACKWYFSRQELEDYSPSRKDGIDLEKESALRTLYCAFIHELGKALKVPQLAIACAWMLCHRFYLRQSHAKNDWKIIATVSMFLACKIHETPRLLRDVVVVSYELMHKEDPSAPQRIRRTEFCDKQKELVICAERVLLATIAFDFDIQLPYRALVDALKNLEIAPEVAKASWNFVNDWLCTTLCLQFKPHYVAAGSLFLASKLKKVKLPRKRGKVWWLAFDISPKHLEDVIQEMYRLWALMGEKNQSLPLKDEGASRPGASARTTVVDSPPSTLTSISTSQPARVAVIDPVASGNANRKASPCQTIDSGTTTTMIGGDGIESQPITKVSKPTSSDPKIRAHDMKIDADRIRLLALKRRRSQGVASATSDEGVTVEKDSDSDGDAWIERELENGIELESSAPSGKKRKELL